MSNIREASQSESDIDSVRFKQMEEENNSLRKSLMSMVASVKSDKKSSAGSKQAVPQHRNLQGILSPQKSLIKTIPSSPHGRPDAVRILHTTNK